MNWCNSDRSAGLRRVLAVGAVSAGVTWLGVWHAAAATNAPAAAAPAFSNAPPAAAASDFYQRFKRKVAENYGLRYEFDWRWRTTMKNNTKDFRDPATLDYTRHGQFDDREAAMRYRTRFGLGIKPLWWLMRNEANPRLRTLRDIEVYARLVNEFTEYIDPGRSVWIDEVLLDQLYLDVPTPYDVPFSVRVGRQDWFYGDGFMISDGTPADSTRTHFFDGVRWRWHLDKMLRDWADITTMPHTRWPVPKTDADFLFAFNRNENYAALGTGKRSRSASWRNQNARLNDRDELLAGLYITSLLWDKTTGATHWTYFNKMQWEPYYLFKAEYPYFYDDGALPDFQRKAYLNALGTRLTGNILDTDIHTLSYESEWALELGQHTQYPEQTRQMAALGWLPPGYRDGNEPIVAAGGYVGLEDAIKRVPWNPRHVMPFQPKIKGLIGWLSGDGNIAQPGVDHGWHPMFSRTDDIFGESAKIYADALGMEYGANWWSNLQLYQIGLSIEPFQPFEGTRHTDVWYGRANNYALAYLKKMTWSLAYQHLRANTAPFKGRAEFSDSNLCRGNAILGGIHWKLSEYLAVRMIYETLWPGKYYDNNPLEQITYPGYSYLARTRGYGDPAYYVRFELMLSF